MAHINVKYVYLKDQNKHHSKFTIKWLQMFNFDMFPKWEQLMKAGAIVGGWIYSLFFLLDVRLFSWEFLIRGAQGVGFALISGMAVTVGRDVAKDFYTLKIKPKIFKNGKNEKTKTNKADEAA